MVPYLLGRLGIAARAGLSLGPPPSVLGKPRPCAAMVVAAVERSLKRTCSGCGGVGGFGLGLGVAGVSHAGGFALSTPFCSRFERDQHALADLGLDRAETERFELEECRGRQMVRLAK